MSARPPARPCSAGFRFRPRRWFARHFIAGSHKVSRIPIKGEKDAVKGAAVMSQASFPMHDSHLSLEEGEQSPFL